jgi:alpha-L-fucosidase
VIPQGSPRSALWLVIVAVTIVSDAAAQESDRPTPENLAAREWFQDARFGLFIHWGASSLLQDGEWVMENRRIRVDDYEHIAPLFNPVDFDAAEWVGIAKAAGMRYITLITKHHDGFALWDSRLTDWDVMERTPFRRDVVRELADEARRQGIKLFLYHSQLDWHHPDYFPRGRTGRSTGRAEQGDWSRYLEFMDGQLRELLTNYGPIGGIWFDGMWDKPEADWRLDRTYRMIHQLQPAALIIPNHHLAPLPGEDVQTFEKDLPGANTAGFNTTTIGTLPLETSETMNDSWGFRLTDQNWKSSSQLIRALVNAAGRNANFLLNVGPTPAGKIPAPSVQRLKEMGDWLARYGASIFGTRGGPVAPRPWGVTTQKGNLVYLHVLDWQDRQLALPPFERRVRSASLLAGGSRVPLQQTVNGIVLTLPARSEGEVDQVVVLELVER